MSKRNLYKQEILEGKRTTKPCPGPFHKGKELSLEEFSLRKKGVPGYYRSYCKECECALQTQAGTSERHGWIELKTVVFVFIELRERLGFNESSRRTGISKSTLSKILNKKPPKRIRKETFQKAARALAECRKSSELRNHREIRHSHELRGKSPPKGLEKDHRIRIRMSEGEKELRRDLKYGNFGDKK